MKEIELSQGYKTIVDDIDFDFLNQFSWSIMRSASGAPYARRIDSERNFYMLSRVIMRASPKLQVDHINHDTLDNRRCNLRLCTASQNSGNRLLRIDTSSKYKGVDWNKNCKKWRVRIGLNSQSKYLGLFVDEIQAAEMYDSAAMKFFGDFACLNFPVK